MSIRDFFRRKPKPYDLGTVLLEMHVVEAPQLIAAVEAQKATPGTLLGEVLCGMGVISSEQLEKALDLQKMLRNGKRLAAHVEMTQHNFRSALKRISTPPQVQVP